MLMLPHTGLRPASDRASSNHHRQCKHALKLPASSEALEGNTCGDLLPIDDVLHQPRTVTSTFDGTLQPLSSIAPSSDILIAILWTGAGMLVEVLNSQKSKWDPGGKVLKLDSSTQCHLLCLPAIIPQFAVSIQK